MAAVLCKKIIPIPIPIKKLSKILWELLSNKHNTKICNVKKNDSIITDMGFSFTTTHQAIDIKMNQKFYTNSGHAPMGWGLPAAIGATFFDDKSCLAT